MMAAFNSLHPTRSFHSKPLLESNLNVLREGAFSDVTFIVGPRKERIPGHQLLLKTRSPVFEVMFSERWNQDSNKEVLFEDVDPNIFKKFLQYIYTDNLEAKVSEALQLLQIAHRYDVQTLVSKCEKLIETKLALDDAVDVFQAAQKYERIQLMDKVGDFMAKSMSKLQGHPSFSRVDKQFFMYLLKRNDLKIKEVDLFLLALRWAKNQTGFTVEQSLEDILPLIRFPTMTLNEFTASVFPTSILTQSTVVELLMYFGSNAETRKSMASTLKFSTERRQPVDSAVALYSRDFDDCKLKGEKYDYLYDRLEFDISKVEGTFGPFSELYALFISEPKIALSSISFYCPASTGDSTTMEIDATKTFKIFVEAKAVADWWWKPYRSEEFQAVVALHGINAGEGTITEVTLDTEVPLDSQHHYRISVEETPDRGTQNYLVRDFGCIQRHVSTAVGDTLAYVKNILTSRHRHFGDRYSHAQLIYKLGLKDIS